MAYPEFDGVGEADVRVELELGSLGVELGACPQLRTHGLQALACIRDTSGLAGKFKVRS